MKNALVERTYRTKDCGNIDVKRSNLAILLPICFVNICLPEFCKNYDFVRHWHVNRILVPFQPDEMQLFIGQVRHCNGPALCFVEFVIED